MPQLTDLARQKGADVLFITDNLTQQIQYGLPPFRNVFWASHSMESVMRLGVRDYIRQVEEENRRQSEVLCIPGVELCPRTYWTGTLKERNLVCRDHQRNLLVLGLHDPELVAGLQEGVGYVWGRHTAWILATRLVVAGLILAVLAGVWGVKRMARRTGIAAWDLRWSLLLTVLLPLLLAAWGLDRLAARLPAVQLYGEDPSLANTHRLLDQLVESGHFAYWAHPASADQHDFRVGPVAFKADTRPYPEALLRTTNYHAFGGLYEGDHNLIEPGQVWDQVLESYLDGRRSRPAWCLGEMLYHHEGQAKTKSLRNVETMVWAEEKTSPAILRALHEGRFYARRNRATQRLDLLRWSAAGGASGQTVTNAGPVVQLSLEAASTEPGEEVEILLVRNGEVFSRTTKTTPFSLQVEDTPPAGMERLSYRVLLKGRHPLEAASNPVFVIQQPKEAL